MSYDFWLEVDAGGEEPVKVEPYFDDVFPGFSDLGFAGTAIVTEKGHARCGNYTYNVSQMYRTAFHHTGMDINGFVGLYDLDKQDCKFMALVLRLLVNWMAVNREMLEPMNPKNGWGNYEGAVTYVWDMQRMCEKHPKAILRIG
jgi:hypothetical protein